MPRQRYYTEINTDVTARIENGHTLYFEGNDFETENRAKEAAKQLRSYTYPVYEKDDGMMFICGYGVPK